MSCMDLQEQKTAASWTAAKTMQGGTMESIALSVGQVADLLQVSSLTVRRMWARGDFVAPVSLGRVIRWRRSDVENWLKNRATSDLYSEKVNQ